MNQVQQAFITQAKATLATAQAMQREVNYWLLCDLAASIDAALDERRTHIRDNQGRLITHFDEWLLAAEAGRWP